MGRVGHRSKIIFCGDMFQNDLVKNKNDVSGLPVFLSVLRNMNAYEEVIFTSSDIVRSSMVKEFIETCERMGIYIGN